MTLFTGKGLHRLFKLSENQKKMKKADPRRTKTDRSRHRKSEPNG